MLCLSDGQKGPRTRARKAVASSSRGSGSTTPTAQLACAALPAPEEPERFPHPPGPGMQVAAGIKVFHSPRIGCQLSDQLPFSSGSWTVLVHGWLRRGSISEGGFGAEGLLLGITGCFKGTGQVPLRSHRAHPSVPVVVANPAIAVAQNRGDAQGETARLCGGTNLKPVFPTLPPPTYFCRVLIHGTITLDGQRSFKCIPRRGKRKSQAKPSLGFAE